ncbi:MAG: glycosyltransferase family 2 protein, partial [Acidimicrobiales bacterium]
HLCAAIESIFAQSYANWELCIADDASQDTELYGILERYRDADPRVKFQLNSSQVGIAANSARAISFATGDYLVFVDADDELQSSALEAIAEEITRDTAPVMVYSDEDKINQQSRRERPYFKPSISPELLLGKNHVTHLTAYHAGHFRKLGGLDSKFDGAQDWEMVLRTIRSVEYPLEQIRHVPQVLYHWRISDSSTAQDVNAKPYAIAAGMRAAREHLESIQVRAEVSVDKTTLRNIIRFPPLESETISILVPSACQNDLILKCINSILPGLKPRVFEIVVGIDHPSPDDSITEQLRDLSEHLPISVVHSERRKDQPFNYSTTMNRLAERANHEFLILLNDDVHAKSDDWIDQLIGPLRIPNVAVSGAKLLYPDRTTQHNGVLLGVTGWAAHEYVGLPTDARGYFDDALLLRNVSAVTAACLATSRNLFQALNGFDAVNFPVAFNDTDFCLRVQENGLRVVVNPQCQLIHNESSTRDPDDSPARVQGFLGEAKALRDRWANTLDADPYYSPNLSLEQHHLYEELPMFEHSLVRPTHPFHNFGTSR